MNYNDKVIDLLKSKYDLNSINVNDSMFLLFSIGKEKDKNYIILENNSTNLSEITELQKFIDSLNDKKYRNASFIFVKCVQKDLNDDYLLFNGSSFLHIFTYNLITLKCKYDIDFHYSGDKKIKELFKDLEGLNV